MSGKAKFIRRGGNKGFTIIELLTVMTIIIILLSVLVPGLNRIRIYAKTLTQHGQFNEISKGLELFRNDHQGNLPDSGAGDSAGVGYCGAMKLCEALVGQDGMGFHPASRFLADGTAVEPNGAVYELYLFNLCTSIDPTAYTPTLRANLQDRIKYVDVESIRAVRLQDLYNWAITAGMSFYDNTIIFSNANNPNNDRIPNSVITDVFLRPSIQSGVVVPGCPTRVGEKVGMPVLYYKADPSKLVHDVNQIYGAPNPNIYNFDDNYAITALGLPWESAPPPGGPAHPMQASPLLFYKAITNKKVTSTPRPHKEDSYILISAGYDGLYGTRDDVFNFTD